jgi:hypothetical protein
MMEINTVSFAGGNHSHVGLNRKYNRRTMQYNDTRHVLVVIAWTIACSSGTQPGGRNQGGDVEKNKFVAESFMYTGPGLSRVKAGDSAAGQGLGTVMFPATTQ